MFPGKSGRARITSAATERLAAKIARAERLDEDDRALLAFVFRSEAKKLANQEAVALEVQRVLPDLRALASSQEDQTHKVRADFFSKAEAVASEVTADDLREVLARVLAGEAVSPGATAIWMEPWSRSRSPRRRFPQSFAVRVQGDVDAVIERNVMRRTGGACIFVAPNLELAGEMNADIIGNDLDECYPLGRASALLVGLMGGILPSETMPVTATGTVNIVGNSFQSCLPATAILFEVYDGRIERNQILSVVQECALPSARMTTPAAIILGDYRPYYPAVTPTVRYNDMVGNAHAGLRSGTTQTTQVDARCNYWGSATGPSGIGPGLGDSIEDDVGAVTPLFEPWATAPIAATSRTCD